MLDGSEFVFINWRWCLPAEIVLKFQGGIIPKQKPPNKNRPVLPGGFSSQKSDCLFAVAEAPRPPTGLAGLAIVLSTGCRLGRGGGRRLRRAVTDRYRRIRLGIDQEAYLFAHG
jgi:hypothetical protein